MSHVQTIPKDVQDFLDQPVECIECPFCGAHPPDGISGGTRYKWVYLHIRDGVC